MARQLNEKEQLKDFILDLCIFVKLYGRGRCAELIGYWQFLGVDKISMAEAYFKGVRRMEGMVGMFNGMVTLPRIADVYEALGRFLKDLNLLSEVSCKQQFSKQPTLNSSFSGLDAATESVGDQRVIAGSGSSECRTVPASSCTALRSERKAGNCRRPASTSSCNDDDIYTTFLWH